MLLTSCSFDDDDDDDDDDNNDGDGDDDDNDLCTETGKKENKKRKSPEVNGSENMRKEEMRWYRMDEGKKNKKNRLKNT